MMKKIGKTIRDAINEAPWGTHICFFYQSRKDLIDILVPYFKAGLDKNEFCMWVTSEPLPAEEAKASLKKVVKNLDSFIRKGQIEIIDASHWYTKSGKFEADKVCKGWVKKEREALKKGYDGLRLSGNTFWLEKRSLRNFADYESRVNKVISKNQMTAICSYSLDRCGASEVIDVVSNHQLALLKKRGKWELIENSKRKEKEKTLSKRKARLQILQQLTEAVHSTLDLEKVFQQITDGIVHSLGYTAASIVTLNDEKKCFEIKALSAKNRLLAHLDKILGFYLKNLSFLEDSELNAAVKSVMKGKIVVAKTLAEIEYPLIGKRKLSTLQKIRRAKNYIIIPLKVDREVAGGVVITSSRKDVSEEELKMLNNFTRVASQAIKNASLHLQAKLAGEAMKKSEKRFRLLFDRVFDAIVMIDERGQIIDINEAASRLLGYTIKELLNLSIEDIHPQDEMKKTKAAIVRILKKNIDYLGETALRRKDGKIIRLEAEGVSFKIGNKTCIIESFRDPSRRRSKEQELKKSLKRLQKSFEEAINAITLATERRDPYFAGHQKRVTNLACAIAKEMGLSKEQIVGLRIAGLIHDIGKTQLPNEILEKPGQLSETEFNLIKTHPQIGYDMLKTIEFPYPVAKIILQHHESLNGYGYPDGLLGKEIILEARILGVADVIEAMSSHRHHRSALGIGEALEEVAQNRGALYDPEAVDACLKLFYEKGFKFEYLMKQGISLKRKRDEV